MLSRKAVPRHRSFPLSAAPKKPNWRWGEVSASRLFCPPSSRAARPARGVSFHLCLLREPRVARMGASVRMWLLELLSLAAPHPYESHALRAWLLVFARGCSSSSRWLPRARPVLPPLGRSSLRRGLLAARWRFAPALSLPEHVRWSVQNSNSNATRRGPNTRASQLTWLGPLLVPARPDPGGVCVVCEGVVSLGLAVSYPLGGGFSRPRRELPSRLGGGFSRPRRVSYPLVSSLSDVTTSHLYYWSSGLVRLPSTLQVRSRRRRGWCASESLSVVLRRAVYLIKYHNIGSLAHRRPSNKRTFTARRGARAPLFSSPSDCAPRRSTARQA